jgi:hypothetical protein
MQTKKLTGLVKAMELLELPKAIPMANRSPAAVSALILFVFF